MIAEYGRAMFHLALGVIIISGILVPVLPALGLPVPSLLIKFSAILALMTGKVSLSTLADIATTATIGVTSLFLLGALIQLIRPGAAQLSQALSLKTLATYLALWIPVANGIDVIFHGIAYLVASLYPAPLANGFYTLINAAMGFTKFAVVYYLFVRALGLPNE